MANEVENLAGIAVASIEKISGVTDANMENIAGLEFTAAASYPSHTGGSSTTSGVYKFVTFTSSGTFNWVPF